ncbi:MAG: hypothetical protein K6G61_07900 [Solobacterium sp.]|nr:hypothetical protein [Solobacterium sp.]
MRKVLTALLCVFLLAGCGSKEHKNKTVVYTPKPAEESAAEEITEETVKYDIDLADMSSTVIFAEISNMMNAPQDYEGKYIRIKGFLKLDDSEGEMLFNCVVPDATQCCLNGIRFYRTGEYKYPDDYPEEGTEIIVEGTFSYIEDTYLTVLCLDDAVMYMD